MTIRCFSTTRMITEWGVWSITNLDRNRDEAILESARAEIFSKTQNLYCIQLRLDNTNFVDWNCAYCRAPITIVFNQHKRRWYNFVCNKCKPIGYKGMVIKSLRAYTIHVQNLIKNNVDI